MKYLIIALLIFPLCSFADVNFFETEINFWDEEKKEFWPDSERRVGRHHDGSARPTRKGGPKSRRRTRRPKRSEGSDRSGPSRKPKKSED